VIDDDMMNSSTMTTTSSRLRETPPVVTGSGRVDYMPLMVLRAAISTILSRSDGVKA